MSDRLQTELDRAKKRVAELEDEIRHGWKSTGYPREVCGYSERIERGGIFIEATRGDFRIKIEAHEFDIPGDIPAVKARALSRLRSLRDEIDEILRLTGGSR